jgi:hypothetical protein
MDHEPSIFFNQVIGSVGDAKLADEMGHKICPQTMIGIFRAIDARSFSMVPSEMRKGREHVFEVLDRNHDAIHASIWATNEPTVSTVLNAIQARRRIAGLFASESELELLEEKLTAATKSPGWLAIEASEGLLKKASGSALLSVERVMKLQVEIRNREHTTAGTLFSMLQGAGMGILNERKRMLAESEHASMPMSTDRISRRVVNAPAKYPVPSYVREHAYSAGADSVVFKDRLGATEHRSRIVLFPPRGLEVVETGDGLLVAVVSSGKGAFKFVGLSLEEQEFLKPLYSARTTKQDKQSRDEGILRRRALLNGESADYHPMQLRL